MIDLSSLPIIDSPSADGSSRVADSASSTTADVAEYRCPREDYSISSAIHLARLANFYDKCRDCPHAHDDGGLLSSARRRQLDARPQQHRFESFFDTSGILGIFGRELSTGVARQVAMAAGVRLRDDRVRSGDGCLLATDGGPLTPEIVAAASEALRWCGLSVVDLGATTAPALVATQLAHGAAASLYIAQARQPAHQVTLQFWGPDARPWSLPGTLEHVRQLAIAPLDRPTRRGGTVSRDTVVPEYLDRLRSYYHALRPLRIVLDTACEPWRQQFSALLDAVRCELIPAGTDLRNAGEARTTLGSTAGLSSSAKRMRELTGDAYIARRLISSAPPALPCPALGTQVVESSAHMGLWVSDDGQSLVVVDEQGAEVCLSRIAVALATASSTTAHIEPTDIPETAYLALRAARAGVGAGGGSRLWFADRYPPLADPLAAVTVLLVLLSQSDRALSEVLDANARLP
ncbi:MAG: hypothetical protein K2Y37_02450 [Pirellulales bacterium]|nr:hypothetical protein [Pirellulales bacterium]